MDIRLLHSTVQALNRTFMMLMTYFDLGLSSELIINAFSIHKYSN